jgi:hypothetical protein
MLPAEVAFIDRANMPVLRMAKQQARTTARRPG